MANGPVLLKPATAIQSATIAIVVNTNVMLIMQPKKYI